MESKHKKKRLMESRIAFYYSGGILKKSKKIDD